MCVVNTREGYSESPHSQTQRQTQNLFQANLAPADLPQILRAHSETGHAWYRRRSWESDTAETAEASAASPIRAPPPSATKELSKVITPFAATCNQLDMKRGQ